MSMTKFIDYNGKKYEVKEPTISMWMDIMKLKDILDEQEMYVRMISKVTGIKEGEIMDQDATTIRKVGHELYKFMNQDLAEKVVDLWKGGGGYLALSRLQTSKTSQSMQPMISG